MSRRSDCTVFQYIGELCRYLVNSPPHPRETAHRLRLSCGNGLRPDVWDEFRRRFAIPRNLEFYAATEANFSLYNCEGRARLDRPHSGFPVAPLPGRAGEIRRRGRRADARRGRVVHALRPRRGRRGDQPDLRRRRRDGGSPFEGYTDRAASAKKILRNVFAPGDAWFRSGDLMRKDARGFYYFVDRIGDTFRWKGENVSTTEVAEAVSTCPGVSEAVVYGVAVPGADGRAGMAAIVTGAGFDFAALRRHLGDASARVCPAAVPARARCDRGDRRPSSRRSRNSLREGYDPGADRRRDLCRRPRATGAFVRVDAALFRESGAAASDLGRSRFRRCCRRRLSSPCR